MQNLLRFLLLLKIKILSRLFYRLDMKWPEMPHGVENSDIRLIAFLNHTSLFEWLFAGGLPNSMLWRIAKHALVPAAEHTMRRPFVGLFLKLLAPHFVSITREPDHTWTEVLRQIGDKDPMVIIFPEGRMKRANGLDKHGKPMTVRGGISDILRSFKSGKMLIAYSGGLHHVQIPGQKFPRLFQKISMKLELVDIANFNREVLGEAPEGEFKRRVKAELERRRDAYCV